MDEGQGPPRPPPCISPSVTPGCAAPPGLRLLTKAAALRKTDITYTRGPFSCRSGRGNGAPAETLRGRAFVSRPCAFSRLRCSDQAPEKCTWVPPSGPPVSGKLGAPSLSSSSVLAVLWACRTPASAAALLWRDEPLSPPPCFLPAGTRIWRLDGVPRDLFCKDCWRRMPSYFTPGGTQCRGRAEEQVQVWPHGSLHHGAPVSAALTRHFTRGTARFCPRCVYSPLLPSETVCSPEEHHICQNLPLVYKAMPPEPSKGSRRGVFRSHNESQPLTPPLASGRCRPRSS